ncbi:TetR/AcrR family transcriptional regulator [Nocardia cyriacigeorgica]|uniref:TetR/AcrR family transcriptional regulator n=1 Tax=Nocardia cyriacigeorgica TaxID=135487 RepID=UPI0018940FFC|nr:TetR/AcrR family transcriptional regulator [Nocardia cyriacigeorgica]MBF6455726.1 TetR/AcrR family transcriptional regulator [Nocardia cyriacigeorgica]MBF6479963.1 TetR/AcrR family transcriptional regulator [Nocardia cyriacigeorgica]MBF6553532.1 TetR/AcrR family transcriptional regulator [Nocardia cyriacigeorgica]
MREVKKPEVRKAEIVDAALALFTEFGFEKTTVEAIVGRLGVAKGCFYHHFRSKSDVLEECVTTLARRMERDYLDIIGDRTVAPGRRLVAYLDYNYELAAAPASAGFLADLHTRSFDDVHKRVTGEVVAALLPAMTRLLEDGVAAGEFDVTDAESTAVAILGALTGLHEFYAGRPELDLARHRRHVLDLLGRILATELA